MSLRESCGRPLGCGDVATLVVTTRGGRFGWWLHDECGRSFLSSSAAAGGYPSRKAAVRAGLLAAADDGYGCSISPDTVVERN